jgi:hypothetical protein
MSILRRDQHQGRAGCRRLHDRPRQLPVHHLQQPLVHPKSSVQSEVCERCRIRGLGRWKPRSAGSGTNPFALPEGGDPKQLLGDDQVPRASTRLRTIPTYRV